MYRVVHFEIQVDDPQRAMAFYTAAFGWRFQDYSAVVDAPYWGVITGEDDQTGINGGLLPRPAAAPAPEQGANAYVCTVDADDYERAAARILAAGGQVALPKQALTGMAWQGYFLDTEGNTFGLHVPDPDAA